MKWEKKIIEVGGSYGLIIPLDVLKYLNLSVGDEVEIQDEEKKKGRFISIWKKGN